MSAARHRPIGQAAVFDPVDVHHLAVVAGGKHFVGLFDIGARQRAFLHVDAVGAQQRQHALARDAVQESAVVGGRGNDAVLGEPQVGGGELGKLDVAAGQDGVGEDLVNGLG